MKTKNIVINGVNWKQRNYGNIAWYLINQLGWMFPNRQLCKVLSVHDCTLSRWAKRALAAESKKEEFILTAYIPAAHINLNGEATNKVQLVWTEKGVSWLLNKSGFMLDNGVRKFLLARKKLNFLLSTHEAPATENSSNTHSTIEKAAAAFDTDLTKALKEFAKIIQDALPVSDNSHLIKSDLEKLRKINFNLVLENEKHKSTIKELKSKLAEKENFTTPELPKLFDNEEYYVPAAFRKQALPETKLCIDLAIPNSLSLYINNYKKSYTVDELNNLGLFNATRLYLETFSKFIDPTTGQLVDKNKFYNILRGEFVLTTPRARYPKVLLAAEISNYAVVTQVVCPKMNNPKLPDGTILEKDNPAFKCSKEPNLRPQIRYTAKAKKYLETTWDTLCEEYTNGTNKRKSYSGAKSESTGIGFD